MSRALLQQALDALESVLKAHRLDDIDSDNRSTIIHAVSSAEKAIAILQAAIAQPEPEPAKPLTDEQIEALEIKFEIGSRESSHWSFAWHDFARAVEAAHGIRPAPEVRRARPDDTEGGAP